MALNDLELSLMTFPQRWDGVAGTLSLNLLLLPVGDPTAPLGTGPQFAGTAVDSLGEKLTLEQIFLRTVGGSRSSGQELSWLS